MRSKQELLQLREQIIDLRRAGKSRREIKEALGPMSNATLNWALQGEPPPESTRRPNAKDAVRAQARQLREKGLDYEEIAAELGVSKGSVSLWVRDMPRPPHLSYEESRKRSAAGVRRYWAAERPVRDAARQAVIDAAAAEIGPLTDRELLIAGAIAYWCEGAKGKPRRRSDQVAFINSDPGLIRLFLCFLDSMGVEPVRMSFRLQIHENADIAAAKEFWRKVTGARASQFKEPTRKRHNPKTLRKKTGEDYHGCLVVVVAQSAELYQQIAGWAEGAMAPTPPASPPP
jgi:transcriptional regulator with XRE-family HTH domain